MKKINWQYPLQEIAIIIVGILLALGINNWWNELQNDQLSREYLVALQDDIKIDASTIQYYKQRTEERILEPLERALNQFFSPDPTKVSLDTFVNDVQMTQYVNIYTLRTGTYEDLKSTGNLRLIKNADLRNELHDYYDRHEYYKIYYEGFLDDKVITGELLTKKIPFRYFHHDIDLRDKAGFENKSIDRKALLEDTELENIVYRGLVTNRWIIRSFDNMANRALRIDSILTSELKK